MGKKLEKSNYRIEVNPLNIVYQGLFKTSKDENDKVLAETLAQIRRHIDRVSASIICDHNLVCEYCGARWTETGNHNGGCCAEDEKVFLSEEDQ